MTGNRESARFVLALLHYYEYEHKACIAYYKRRICRTDISEEQLQYIVDQIEDKRIKYRVQYNHLMNF
jgi:hypothetical protein